MQYLLQDLIKLPLSERLIIVEKLISTIVDSDYEEQLDQLKKMFYQNLQAKRA